jgi:hypothetical protein
VLVVKVFVGHDWAEAHHDVHVEDEGGQRLAAVRLPEGIEGVRRFHELVGAYTEEPAEVTVATETERGLFVGSLVAAGYRVLAVNPMSRRVIGNGIRRRERSLIPAMRKSWPSSPVSTVTIIGRSRGTVISRMRSRCWPGLITR